MLKDIVYGIAMNLAFILIFLMVDNYHQSNREIENEQKGENNDRQIYS